MDILKWFSGGNISINVNSVEIKIAISLDGHVTLSVSGDIDSVINFVKGLVKK